MRYLINLPIAGALLCGAIVVYLTVLTMPPRGGDAAIGAAMAIVASAAFFWLLLAVSVICCALAGGFAWLPADGGSRLLLVLLALVAVALLSLLPTGIAIEVAGRETDARWSTATIWAARAAGFGVPFILLVYSAWLVNAPEALRQGPASRQATLTAVAVLLVAGAVVSVQELVRWNESAVAQAAAERTAEDAKAVAHRRKFEALTDADTLFAWDEFTYHSSPDDIRLEAMRRIALRPGLEAELIEVLSSENDLWAAEGVRLVAELAFVPSATLVAAARRRLDGYAARLRKDADTITYDGDKRIDYYETSRLREALAVGRKVAETTGADFRPQIDGIRRAVALYPKSETARTFPREAAAGMKDIEALLRKRPPQ